MVEKIAERCVTGKKSGELPYFIKEKMTLWGYLQKAQYEKPVVIYGTGDGADKIMKELDRAGVKTSGIYVTDEFYRGQEFKGFTVKKISELLAKGEENRYIVLIAFASELPEMLDFFRKLSKVQEVYAPHVPLFPADETVSFSWLAEHKKELEEVYEKLADDLSRKVMAGTLNYKLSGKAEYLWEVETAREDDMSELFLGGGNFGTDGGRVCETESVRNLGIESAKDGERDLSCSSLSYCDLGAYNGDTAEEFLRLSKKSGKLCEKLVAVEPDPKNFAALEKKVSELEGEAVQVEDDRKNEQEESASGYSDCVFVCFNVGIWSLEGQLEFNVRGGRQASCFSTALPGENAKRPRRRREKWESIPVNSIDNLAAECSAQFTHIKMDVEGAEKEALTGGKEQIKRNGPRLFVAAYHHDEDLFTLPLCLWKIRDDYKIYLRKHPYLPAWELNFIALAD